MKKNILSLVCLPLLVMALAASTASAWGPGTHSYIAKELGRKFGYLNLQEMYGANAPDFPGVMLDPEYYAIRDRLGYLTHYEFKNVVKNARWSSQKAFAYGFATHNQEWGADYWAHIAGYTKNQAAALVALVTVENPTIWTQVEDNFGLDPLWVAEMAVEYGIDILIKENLDPAEIGDPEIGLRVLGSALVRSPTVPLLLARAYAAPLASVIGASPFEAAKIIIAGEKQFRQLTIRYGTALSQEDPVDALAEIAATQFAYLITTTEPPPDPQVLKGLLKELAKQLLLTGMNLCKPTYSKVLQKTIDYVAPEDYGIPLPYTNFSWWRSLDEPEMADPTVAEPSVKFSLGQNHPNPLRTR